MLKVGVFGAGHLGKIHIQQWLEIPGIRLVGFYDPNDDNAAAAITEYHLKRYTDAAELIDAADALDIVTSTTHHFETAKACLLQSRHIFIEKPMTQSMEQARELVQLVAEANVKCQVGHVERYNPAMLALKGQKLEPMFIETHRLAQFNPRGTDVAVILDLMIHDIDIIMHLVKSPVRRISASGVAVISDTADIANARIEFDNGCVANLTASRISLKKMRKMRLFQKDAYIGIDFLDKKTEVIRMKGEHESKGFFDFPIEVGNGQQKTISIDTPQIRPVNAIREELADFALSVLQDKPVTVSVYDGLHAMDVAHQILEKVTQQMNAEGKPVT
ncbi:MAG: Gfo/Idh/MocA family oxidoreductase [Edaphocola sp.]